jgi:hypothetical protein
MFDGADMSVRPFYVGPEVWPAFAERLRPHLEQMAAGSGGRYLAEDIAAAIAESRMQLWLALEGADILCAMVTELAIYPRLRAMRCVGIVGHRPWRWMRLLANVEQCAREKCDCTVMEALTQPEHVALLRTGGWRTWHVMSEKTL